MKNKLRFALRIKKNHSVFARGDGLGRCAADGANDSHLPAVDIISRCAKLIREPDSQTRSQRRKAKSHAICRKAVRTQTRAIDFYGRPGCHRLEYVSWRTRSVRRE